MYIPPTLPIDKLGSGVKLPQLQKLNQQSGINDPQASVDIDSIVDSTNLSLDQKNSSRPLKIGSVLLNMDVLETADPDDLKKWRTFEKDTSILKSKIN